MYLSVLPAAITTCSNLCSKIAHSEGVSLSSQGDILQAMIQIIAA
jgi:hypothetical protein